MEKTVGIAPPKATLSFHRVREGARDAWSGLGRPGQATLLSAALVAVMGMMLATASSAAAGTCTGAGPVDVANIEALLPVA